MPKYFWRWNFWVYRSQSAIGVSLNATIFIEIVSTFEPESLTAVVVINAHERDREVALDQSAPECSSSNLVFREITITTPPPRLSVQPQP